MIVPAKHSKPLTLAEALDPSILSSTFSFSIPGQPFTDRHDVIDAYIMMKRSSEEISLLDNEMKNTISHYSERERTILSHIELLHHSTDAYSRGAKALLYNLLLQVRKHLEECNTMFSVIDQLPSDYDVYEDDFSDSTLMNLIMTLCSQ